MHIHYIWVMFRADRYSSFTIAVHLLAALQSLILSPIPMCNSSAHNPLAGLLYVDTGMYLYMHFPGYDNFFILSISLSHPPPLSLSHAREHVHRLLRESRNKIYCQLRYDIKMEINIF